MFGVVVVRDQPHQSWDLGDRNIAGEPRAMPQSSADGDKKPDDDDKTEKTKVPKNFIKDNSK